MTCPPGYRKAWGLRQHGKPCRKCGSLERYPNGNCKPCGVSAQRRSYETEPLKHKKRQVARYYGITGEEKEAIYAKQNGACAFCFEPLPGVWTRGCHVEHDHKSGRVRGLVHHQCNVIIGILESDRYKALAKEYFR